MIRFLSDDSVIVVMTITITRPGGISKSITNLALGAMLIISNSIIHGQTHIGQNGELRLAEPTLLIHIIQKTRIGNIITNHGSKASKPSQTITVAELEPRLGR